MDPGTRRTVALVVKGHISMGRVYYAVKGDTANVDNADSITHYTIRTTWGPECAAGGGGADAADLSQFELPVPVDLSYPRADHRLPSASRGPWTAVFQHRTFTPHAYAGPPPLGMPDTGITTFSYQLFASSYGVPLTHVTLGVSSCGALGTCLI